MLFIISILLCTPLLFAEATHNRNVTAEQLASQIQGEGITISNPVITRGQIGGNNSQVATFTNGINGANLKIDKGILLTACTADQAFLPNTNNKRSLRPGTQEPYPRSIDNRTGLSDYDSDLLSTISQTRIGDQVVFEFDVVLDKNTRLLLVDYQFASDEYPEWVGSKYNDAFGFFISGGDLNKTYNIARVVDSSTIVTTENILTYATVNINTVNNGNLGSSADGARTTLTNTQYFIDNGGIDNEDTTAVDTNKTNIISEFDGFTTKLHASLDNLTPGVKYHFKMALGDTSDQDWDAGVFVNKIKGLREPTVCYDYDVRVSNIVIPSKDRHIKTDVFAGEHLYIGVVLKSLEGEIALDDTNLTVKLTPNNSLKFLNAEVSPDTINAYVPIDASWVKTPHTTVPVGERPNASGGTIMPHQTIFTSLTYDFTGPKVNTILDLELHFSLNLNGIIRAKNLKTSDGSLERCPTQAGYNPIWASLNVERRNSVHVDSDPKEQYVLYTQISGREFDIDVVSYDPNNTSELKDISNLCVELEIIDAGKYADSNQSLFTCKTPEISANSKIACFRDTATNRVEVEEPYKTDTAIKNAAFRLWYLSDGNGSYIGHQCELDDNNCFKNIYKAQFKDKIDTESYCTSACSSGNGCYECLRTFFGKPICSRDNFSVRPVSYRLKISDNDQGDASTAIELYKNDDVISSSDIPHLAAEYDYRIDGNATIFGSDDNASGYYAFFKDSNNDDLISEFQFDDSKTLCNDINNSHIGMGFFSGKIRYSVNGGDLNTTNVSNLYSHDNTGSYLYHIKDNNWTIVDQKRYPLKTIDTGKDDCVINDFSVSISGDVKSGCGISSDLTNNANLPSDANTYTDLPVSFEPYQFNLSNMQLVQNPYDNKYLFMNDFSKDNGIDPSMSVAYDGDIIAQGSKGNTLSNFVTGCSASNVRVTLDVNTSDENQSIHIVYDSNISTGHEGNITLTIPSSKFIKESNGSANAKIYTTVKKPYRVKDEDEPINPVRISYAGINAFGDDAVSKANLGDHTPTGRGDVNQSVIYVYGKVVPEKLFYEDVKENFENTALFINVYCQDTDLVDCNATYGINSASRGELADSTLWYDAASLFPSTSTPGSATRLEASMYSERDSDPLVSAPAISADKNIDDVPFNNLDFASQIDINVSTQNNNRPSTVKIVYKPSPWLIDNEASQFYKVRFIGPDSWAGVGDTGNVVGTKSNSDENRRMNW